MKSRGCASAGRRECCEAGRFTPGRRGVLGTRASRPPAEKEGVPALGAANQKGRRCVPPLQNAPRPHGSRTRQPARCRTCSELPHMNRLGVGCRGHQSEKRRSAQEIGVKRISLVAP